MFLYPDSPQNCITLSPAVLDELKRMSAGRLRVYIYLCAWCQSQPFSAPIPQIKAATGLGQRSVVAALKALCEKKLITRTSGRGSQPNQYCILLPKRQETAVLQTKETTAPPNPGVRQAAPPTVTPTKTPIRELIAASYRPLDDWEFAQLQRAQPDEAVLREKLKGSGGVASDMNFDFFVAAINKPSLK